MHRVLSGLAKATSPQVKTLQRTDFLNHVANTEPRRLADEGDMVLQLTYLGGMLHGNGLVAIFRYRAANPKFNNLECVQQSVVSNSFAALMAFKLRLRRAVQSGLLQ